MKNTHLIGLVQKLKELSSKESVPLWKRIALELEGSTRRQRVVNISKIQRYAKDGEIILVPGKVLGTGDFNKKLSVVAYKFSDSAKKKLAENKCDTSIEELMKKNPKGSKVRIMG